VKQAQLSLQQAIRRKGPLAVSLWLSAPQALGLEATYLLLRALLHQEMAALLLYQPVRAHLLHLVI